jgi:hypothetical protein
MWFVASLRSMSAAPAMAGLVFFAAVGCQAILGIDDTSFQSGDSGATDAAIADATNDATAPTDSGSDAQPAAPTVTFSPTRPYVVQGGEVDVTVTLARNGFAGDVTLALASVGDAGVTSDGGDDAGGADGISAATLTIPSTSTTGILHLFAGTTATLGPTTLDFTLTAASSSVASLPALIGGPSGSLDKTFGINGVAAVVSNFTPVSVAVGDDDSVWVLNNTWTVLHYFADGTSDDALNAELASTLGSISGSATRIVVHDGFLWICGNDGGSAVLLKRATSSGAYDSTFFSGGKYYPKDGSNSADGSITGIAFSPTGDILLSAVVTGPTQNLGGVVYRVSGTTTTTFVIGTPFVPEGIGVDPTGRIGTGGLHTTADGGSNLFGQVIDTSFNDAGLASLGNPADGYTAQKAVVTAASQIAIAATQNHIQPNGTVVAFSTVDGTSAFLYHQNYTGTWDQGFASIASRSSGLMYVTDESGGGETERAFVARVGTDGGADSTFTFSVGSPNSSPFLSFDDVAVDSVGRVIAAGTSDTNLYLARVWP